MTRQLIPTASAGAVEQELLALVKARGRRSASGSTRRPQHALATVSGMPATIEDAEEVAVSLPDVTVGERYRQRTWMVAGKGFAWERPFSKADIKRFGTETPPDGPIVAVRVADLEEKEVVLAQDLPGFFTIPHFDGYAAVLIQLRIATKTAVRNALVDGWLAVAPRALADEHAPALLRRRR